MSNGLGKFANLVMTLKDIRLISGIHTYIVTLVLNISVEIWSIEAHKNVNRLFGHHGNHPYEQTFSFYESLCKTYYKHQMNRMIANIVLKP